MQRLSVLLFGVISYLAFFASILYSIGFLGNFGVTGSIDAQPGRPTLEAVLINLGLLALFSLQHSGMARRGFKRWITRFIPQAAERSAYVLLSSLALGLVLVFWQPMGGVIWNVDSTVAKVSLITLYMAGWALVFVSTFLINHFDLFGLAQSWAFFRGREYQHPKFMTPSLYRIVRHPLYVGWLIVFWAAPTMTVTHLLLAVGLTVYILAAIRLEEKDLVHFHGDDYRRYQESVPMLIPGTSKRAPVGEVVSGEAS